MTMVKFLVFMLSLLLLWPEKEIDYFSMCHLASINTVAEMWK